MPVHERGLPGRIVGNDGSGLVEFPRAMVAKVTPD
jgi:hypothetical protein